MNHRCSAGLILILIAFLVLPACNNSSETISSETDTTGSEELPGYDNIGTSEDKQKLVKKVNSLLVFHADDTMEVNETYIATLALARNADPESLTLKVLEASDAT